MWIRLDSDYYDHPRVIGLSFGARSLFIWLLCTAKTHSSRGDISASFIVPEYISKRIGVTLGHSSAWRKEIIDAGLISIDGDRVTIHNWKQYQMDGTAAERQRAHRAVTDVTVTSVTTPCHGNRTEQNRTIQNGDPNPLPLPLDTPTPQPKTKRTRKAAPAIADAEFDSFWNLYPRKEAKKEAAKAWAKARGNGMPPVSDITAKLELLLKNNWLGRERHHIPLPATWLNGARWDDEIIPPETGETPRERTARLAREDWDRRAEAILRRERDGDDDGDRGGDADGDDGVSDVFA